MIKNLWIFCVVLSWIQCTNPAVSHAPLNAADSSVNDTSERALLVLKEKNSSNKNTDSLGTFISKIIFKVRTDSITDFPEGYVPWISIEYPEKEIEKLLNKNKIVIEDSTVTIIIDYPLNNPVRFELKSKNGFTKRELVRQISDHYHKIYSEEEQTATIKTIPVKQRTKMYNRNQTNGKYGIWGHDLADLALGDILVYRNAEGHIILSLDMES
jgi:hypothetical protein